MSKNERAKRNDDHRYSPVSFADASNAKDNE